MYFTAECAFKMTVSELLGEVLEKSGYEEARRTEGSGERLDNLAELKQSIYEYETTCGEETRLSDYLDRLALFTNEDTAAMRGCVKCMTVHKAKGLEFPYVFICSLEEGVFPAKKTDSLEAMEEERRLAFVAITRAGQRLYLSDSEGRNLDGSFRYPSRFILDIDRRLMTWVNEPDESLVKRARQEIEWKERDMAAAGGERFQPGDRVRHAIMGSGTVLRIDDKKNAYVIHFDELDTERTIRFRVKMERA
jgi:DNA helicase-2/ATP-dependent DNA helicase PcrA